jgi:hypothetical protein
MSDAGYFSVVVPYAHGALRTKWHPTEKGGAFDPLVRGAFGTEAEAHAWARANLGEADYRVVRYATAGDLEAGRVVYDSTAAIDDPERCLVCGHYHGGQGGCMIAVALAWDRDGRHCLNAACAACAAYRARGGR